MLRTVISATVRRNATPALVFARPQNFTPTGQRFHASGSTIHDNDPETLEMEKQRNLKGEQDHTSAPHKQAPGWNEHLASTSEAFIKADRSNATLAELQGQTVDYVKRRHPSTVEKAAKTMANTVSDVKEAANEVRDTIMGPLAGAAGKQPGPDDDTQQTTKHD